MDIQKLPRSLKDYKHTSSFNGKSTVDIRKLEEDYNEINHILAENDGLTDADHNRLVAAANWMGAELERQKSAEQAKAAKMSAGLTGSFAKDPYENKSTYSDGRALDEAGRIKAYAPHERISDGSGDVSLGAFLRAAIDRPRNAVERNLIQNAIGSDGIELPSFVSDELIDLLRAENPLLRAGGAGARTLSIEGLDGQKFVRITGDATSVWHAELTEETPTDPTLDAVTLVPKTILALTEVSREVLQDSNMIEDALTATFTGGINDAILAATFAGTTANGPAGLGSLVTATEEYANGGAPDFSNFVNAHSDLYAANVPEGGRSNVMAPDVWKALNNLQDTTDQPIRKPFGLLDIPDFVSSGVPAGVAYSGDFRNVVYGFRTSIRIEQFPAAAAKKYASLWLAAIRLDMAVFRPSAFVRIEEAAV